MNKDVQTLNSNIFWHFILILSLCLSLTLVACGGSKSLASPQSYGGKSPKTEATESDNENNKKNGESDKPLSYSSSGATQPEKNSNSENDSTYKNEVSTSVLASVKPEDTTATPVDSSRMFFYDNVDVGDSASAVDDDIWRKFDLAEEYQGMGILANREASWEEAQYYFEKALKILAKLDIEEDSLLTPEAVQYERLLENIVADYRVTLRSLGHLEEDVSSSVILERYSDLADNLGRDTLLVYGKETPPVTYDIPIVMNDRVKKSLIYFQTVARDAFTKYLQRSKKYTPMMKKILNQYGLPEDLIYLSLVESGYNPHAYSWARAVGLWQFISSTGRLYDLNRNWWYDERKDPIKSTHAACRFLKDLYEQFGSWELAMAAYNGGPGRVRKSIEKQKTIDFWKMELKRQTMDYVPLIMAAAIIGKNPEKYGFEDIEFEDEVVWEEMEIDKCLELSVVAKAIGCSTQELMELNPELLRKYTPPNTKKYILKIPVGTSHKFKKAYADLPSPKETSWVRHKINKGETVSTIAAKYGVSQYAIFEANNLSRQAKIYAGKYIIVPVPLDRDYFADKQNKDRNYESKNSIYTVRSGDTMWDIARAFGTTVDALRRVNYIGRSSRIYVGQKLKIPSSARKLKEMNKTSPKLYASTEKKSSSKNTSSASIQNYKVKRGDTLWDIARRFGTTTSNLRNLNGLGRSSRIYPGQVLTVNASGSNDYVIHKVKRGESLSKIARRYQTSISTILDINNIDDPDMIQVGDKLRIYLK